MKGKNYRIYLKDIVDAFERCIEFTRGMTENDFYRDVKTQYAVMRALEVAGEAAKRIPEDIRKMEPEIPWKEISGLRDVLIHSYSKIDPERLWLIIKKDLPPALILLKDLIRKINQ